MKTDKYLVTEAFDKYAKKDAIAKQLEVLATKVRDTVLSSPDMFSGKDNTKEEEKKIDKLNKTVKTLTSQIMKDFPVRR